QVAQVRHVELERKRRGELVLVDQLEAHEYLADQAALLALPRERAFDRIGRDATARDQDLADQRRSRPDRTERVAASICESRCGHYGVPPVLSCGSVFLLSCGSV